MNIFCITLPIIVLGGMLTFVFANRRRTVYRPVDASEDTNQARDPYELSKQHRKKVTKKAMKVWLVLSVLVFLGSLLSLVKISISF